MKVIGIVMVRNEADVIQLSVLHHLALGLDAILVIDNGSTDGTARVLEDMGREDRRIQWRTDPGPYQQAAALTALAREAFGQGADWVVPFDADEFWSAKSGDFRSELASATAGALRGPVINFVQHRDQLVASEEALLTMTRRVPTPIGQSQALIKSRQIGYVEMMYPPKWIFQPTADVVIGPGHHSVSAVAGPKAKAVGLACLHAPLRSRDCLNRKADHGMRALQAGSRPGQSWHLKRWARLRAAGELDQEWAANSYVGTSLDVYGRERPLVVDFSLHEAVSPFLPGAREMADNESDSRTAAASHETLDYSLKRCDGPLPVQSAQDGADGARVMTVANNGPETSQMVQEGDDSWHPNQLAVATANAATVAFLKTTPCRMIAEIGIYEGHTSREIAKHLNGEGELHLFDFSDRVDAVMSELAQMGYRNIIGHGNSRKLMDSYNWSLMRVLQQNPEPIYDYVFLDGGHVWALDALAFFLIDRLLKPGGYLDFDDYRWSLAKSPFLNPVAFPMTARMYTEEQIREKQVALVVDLLVKRDQRYVEVAKNKIFKKLESAVSEPLGKLQPARVAAPRVSLPCRDYAEPKIRAVAGDYAAVLEQVHNILKPQVYLEIGVFRGRTLRLSEARAIAIDPAPKIDQEFLSSRPALSLYPMKSDDFFMAHTRESVLGALRVDFAFIDGLHEFDQVLRDFINVERWSSPSGIIAVHDVIPPTERAASRKRVAGAWCGDVWQLIDCLSTYRPDLDCLLIDTRPSGLLLVQNLDPSDETLAAQMGDILRSAPSDDERYLDAVQKYLKRVSAMTALRSNVTLR